MINKIEALTELVKKLNNKCDDISLQLDELLENFNDIIDQEDQDCYVLKEIVEDFKLLRSSITILDAELNGYKGINGDEGLKKLLIRFMNNDRCKYE